MQFLSMRSDFVYV